MAAGADLLQDFQGGFFDSDDSCPLWLWASRSSRTQHGLVRIAFRDSAVASLCTTGFHDSFAAVQGHAVLLDRLLSTRQLRSFHAQGCGPIIQKQLHLRGVQASELTEACRTSTCSALVTLDPEQ